ncbi:MAG: ABC-F family ATP-binding cassette domain-containing protein [Lachnospiraceae bacterium]|nr:ABC-F family ATP-binding cassette domain-containing protein [Lachnospiraceae bacterium]
MNIISMEHMKKSYTGRKLLDDTSFFLHEGDKVGIIGVNGTGKSTLLKMIAGLEEGDEGTVTFGSNLVIRYLPQTPDFNKEDTAMESVRKAAGEVEDVWTLETNAKSMMTRLGITNFEQKTGELSGGQRKRLALVAVLTAPSDVLVLDEPTNHLDSEMSTFLEEYLKNYRGSIVMVTHDRYFLDSVSNRIVELDHGKLYSYEENYSGYLQRKQERIDSMYAAERKRQSILRKEIAWMMRGARARSTKQKAHIKRYETLRDMDGIQIEDTLEISSVSSRLGNTTIELHDICKAYGDKVLVKDFNYIFLKNDRVGFVGKNGCGKTTLMKIILGEVAQDSGDVVTGQTVKIGYYSQEIQRDETAGIAYMDPGIRVIDYIKNTAEMVRTKDGVVTASKMLETFLFDSEKQYSLIEKLSGGEKRRLNLLRVLMEAPNVLILDEPTNDLDIATLQILEDYLDTFEGIVITVSHDRYFLDRVVRRIFAFEQNGHLRMHEGGYTDYENRMKEEGAFEKEEKKPVENGKKVDKNAYKKDAPKKLKFSFNEAREFETIEDDITALEEKIAALDDEMVKNATNSVKLSELLKEKEETEGALEEKMQRWEYLTDLNERIQQG